jgi:hypothetical protein
VHECDGRELAAPTEGEDDTAEGGQHDVATVLSAVETLEGVPPDAVNGMRMVSLGEDIFERDLKYTKNDDIIICFKKSVIFVYLKST